MWIYIIIAVVLIIVIYTFILYNNFVNLNNKIKEAFASMDAY